MISSHKRSFNNSGTIPEVNYAGFPYIWLKENYSGQEYQTFTLKNPFVDAEKSKKKTFPSPFSSHPLSPYQTTLKQCFSRNCARKVALDCFEDLLLEKSLLCPKQSDCGVNFLPRVLVFFDPTMLSTRNWLKLLSGVGIQMLNPLLSIGRDHNKVSPMVLLVLLCFNLVPDTRKLINKVQIGSLHQTMVVLQAKSSRISKPTRTNSALHHSRRHLQILLIALLLILATRTTRINILIQMTLIMIVMFLTKILPRKFTLIMLRKGGY